MRKRIYEIIEPADQSDKWSNLYDRNDDEEDRPK